MLWIDSNGSQSRLFRRLRDCRLLVGWIFLASASSGSAAPESGVDPGRPHSAFERIVSAPPPSVPTHAHGNAIDAFIQAKLNRGKLTPSPEADRATLIRRATFTLTGLPPTPEAIEAFVHDPSPAAYEALVDRLLASPRFGERWARHWLDAAGYADSNGYFNADSDRPLAFRYRDYVIRALNRDKPFRQFIHEQIAGDELCGWTPGQPVTPEIIESLEATHFLRNGQDGSGESDGNPDEVRTDRYYALESAMQIVGSSLLGVTLQCAKCHDHKFEPITQRDYYSFQAFLYPAFHIEKWTKPNDRVVTAALPGEVESWKATQLRLDAELADAQAEFRAWSSSNRPPGKLLFGDDFNQPQNLARNWSATAPGDDAPGGSPPVRLDSTQAPGAIAADGQLRLVEGGGSGDRWLSSVQAFEWQPAIQGAWIQVTFDLVADRLDSTGTPAERIGYFIATHDFNDSSKVEGGNILIDGHPSGASVVEVDYPGKDSSRPGKIGTTGYKPGHNYGLRITRVESDRFQLEPLVDGSVDGQSIHLKARDLPRGGFGFEYCCGRSFVVDNVRIESSDPTNEAWAVASQTYEKELGVRRQVLERTSKRIAAQRTPQPGRIAWMTDSGAEAPPVPLLKRGNHKTPGEAVPAAFPGFLSGTVQNSPAPRPSDRTTGRRTALADWLFQPESPQASLLARVTVNRIWQQYFGTGIVATTDNLGRSGAQPSHPELLEWLAAEFIVSDWSLKALHRRIALSHTFRQSSEPRTEPSSVDPGNRLLWRFPIRRLDAESIRDAMLATSGRLASKACGPYVPTPRNGSGEVNPDPSHPEAFARTIFLQQRRTQVPTFLGTFDAPSMVFNCTRREPTTMPLQTLTLLNSDFTVERGADLAARVLRAESTDEKRLILAFVTVCGRPPNAVEKTASLEFLRAQTTNQDAVSEAVPAAWRDLCHSLYALNAFLYLE